MIKSLERFFIHREHSVLSKIERYFLEDNEIGEDLNTILRSHTAFIFPKTLFFSFTGFPETLKQLDDNTDGDLDQLKITEQEQNISSHSISCNSVDCLSFFGKLVQFFQTSEIHPFILLDLRYLRILDEVLLLKIVERLHKLNLKIIILASDDIRVDLNNAVCNNLCEIFYSLRGVKNHLNQICNNELNTITITLPERITLESLETIFGNNVMEKDLSDKLCCTLDLSKVLYISTFSICILNHFMQTASNRYGLLWKIPFTGIDSSVMNKLTRFRLFDSCRAILDIDDDTTIPEIEYNPKVFGMYVFDEKVQAALLSSFDNYLGKIGIEHSNYLGQYTSVKYDHREQSYKTAVYRRTYFNLISSIVYELIDNVTLHSEGLGYLSVVLSDGHLYIFIGDSGIGLKNGILKNYNLAGQLQNDRNALELLFDLGKYKENRLNKLAFNRDAGYGLKDTMSHISVCKGKLLYRSGKSIASFMNPVSKAYSPSKIFDSTYHLDGTQYLILIPISQNAVNSLPKNTDEFMLK